MKYYRRGERPFSYMSEFCLVCVPVLTRCTWAADAEAQMLRTYFTVTYMGKAGRQKQAKLGSAPVTQPADDNGIPWD